MSDADQTPIGGGTKVSGLGERDYYDEDEGDFGTERFAKVKMGDDVSANDVGMVVDLLNKYDAETIRGMVLNDE